MKVKIYLVLIVVAMLVCKNGYASSEVSESPSLNPEKSVNVEITSSKIEMDMDKACRIANSLHNDIAVELHLGGNVSMESSVCATICKAIRTAVRPQYLMCVLGRENPNENEFFSAIIELIKKPDCLLEKLEIYGLTFTDDEAKRLADSLRVNTSLCAFGWTITKGNKEYSKLFYDAVKDKRGFHLNSYDLNSYDLTHFEKEQAQVYEMLGYADAKLEEADAMLEDADARLKAKL